MTRTITDHRKHSHTLDLDAVLVDGVPCMSVQATEQYVQFELQTGEAVTCELGQFWQEVSGPDLSAPEAGLLLADCLIRQVVLQRTSSALQEAMVLLTRAAALPAEVPSSTWLTTRLDPLARQAMSAYDGSDAMTEMLARILRQSPATIHQWALQLGLEASTGATEDALSPVEVETGPLPVLASAVLEHSEAKQFSWTPQRRQMLEDALKVCPGSTVAERARLIATAQDWSEASVRSKLYEMQRLHRAGFPRVEVSEQPPSCGADAVVSPVAFELAEAGEQPPMTNGSSAVALAQGNCLWTVVCGSDHSRWALDYRYGNFPFQEGQRCLFEGSEYRIESVGTSLLRVALVAEQAPVYDVSLD